MKSARIKGYGSTSDVIEIDQNTPTPNEPSEGKVVVRVKAAGVNPTDWKLSEGYMQQIMPIELPATLGWDFSGIFLTREARYHLLQRIVLQLYNIL